MSAAYTDLPPQVQAQRIAQAVRTARGDFQRLTGQQPIYVYLGIAERDAISMAHGSAPLEILGLRVVSVAVGKWCKVGI